MNKAGVVWHLCTSGNCFIDWMDHWQTMITGVAAVIAAALALVASQTQARAARLGRLRAARTSLPAELSRILAHAEQIGSALDRAWPQTAVLYKDDIEDDREFYIAFTASSIPESVVRALERVVENTLDKRVIERVDAILRENQIMEARLQSHYLHAVTLENLAGLILQAAALHALAASLFPYARQHSRSVDPRPLWDRADEALAVMNITRREVHDLAESERALGMPPGEADTVMY